MNTADAGAPVEHPSGSAIIDSIRQAGVEFPGLSEARRVHRGEALRQPQAVGGAGLEVTAQGGGVAADGDPEASLGLDGQGAHDGVSHFASASGRRR